MKHIRQWIISLVLVVIVLGFWTPREAYGEENTYGFFAFFSEKGYNVYHDVITVSPKNNLMIYATEFSNCMNVDLSYNEKTNKLTIENLYNEKKLVYTVGSKNYQYYDEKNPKGVKQTAEYASYYDNDTRQYVVPASTLKYIMSISVKENCYYDGKPYEAVILCSDYLSVKQMEDTVSTKLELNNGNISTVNTIAFKNPLIEEAVRKALDKTKGNLTEWDVSKIKKLNLSGLDLTDITDLKHLTGLEELNLENNNLQYIGSLRYLTKLKDLSLFLNPISNLEPISELTKLKILTVSGENIFDISPLKNLTDLEELRLLSFSDNVKDFSLIGSMKKLKKLYLRFTYVPDISFLKKCTQLTELTLFNAGISDLTPLKGLTKLTKLDIGQNNIEELDGIKKLTNLTYLNASVNYIKKIDALKGLKKLTYLDLDYNDITELGPVGELTNLEALYINSNGINDIKAVKNLKKLKVLDVAYNRITDISTVSQLSNLTGLYMDNNYFTNYSSVFKLKKLKYLHLCNPMILDYRPLKTIQGQLVAKDFDIEIDTAVAEKATQIISKIIKKDMTDLEKVIAVHDYLVLNTEYDYINYKSDSIPDESYTVYGALINRIAVCAGYAKAFEYLMERIGIRCGTVLGTAYGVDGWDGHAWNTVRLDGEYYHVDVTFDDPINAKPGYIEHTYLNMTDYQIWKDHRWNGVFSNTSLKYNNYFMNDTENNPYKNGATYELSGKITLASDIKVPSDGLVIELRCEGWSDKYGTLVKIPYGERSASYRFSVPKALQNFNLLANATNSKDIAYGYYSAEGNNLEYANMTPVNSSRNTNLNIIMFKEPGNSTSIHLPITVALPKGEAAPKGGVSLKLRLGDVNARGGEAFIPEDENSVTIVWDTGLYESATGYLSYEIEPFIEGYRTVGYYKRDKMTTDSLKADKVTVKEGSSFRIELIKGLDSYTISGRISLPEGQVAPTGGLAVTVYAEATDNRVDRPWAQIPTVKKELIIAKGKSSIDYQLEVREDGSEYIVYYKLKEKSDKYINQAYYTKASKALSYMDALPIDYTNSTGIDLNIIGTYIIKGKVALPAGEVAPRGGLEVTVFVSTDNPYTIPEDTYCTIAFVTIPEGERVAEYQEQVLPSRWTYHIHYSLSSDPSNEKYNKYYDNGDLSDKGHLTLEVNSDVYDANIEIARR